jgi:hypothetical protein
MPSALGDAIHMRVTQYNVIAEGRWEVRVGGGRKVGEIRRKLGRRVYYYTHGEVLPEIFVPAMRRPLPGVRQFCDTLNRANV